MHCSVGRYSHGGITLRASVDRTDLFTIALLEIRDEVLVSPFLTEVSNERGSVSTLNF